jgi:methyl-accepting chemotaxis protein
MNLQDQEHPNYETPFWERIGFRIAVGILCPLIFSLYALVSISGFFGYTTGSFGTFIERKEKIDTEWSIVRMKELSYRVKLAEFKYAVERYIVSDRRTGRIQIDKILNDFEVDLRQAYRFSGDEKRADSRKIYNGIHGAIGFLREYINRMERDGFSSNATADEDRARINLLTMDIEQSMKRLKARFELYELQDQEAVRSQYETVRDNILFLTLFLIISGLLICVVVTYSITSPISKVIRRLRDIANGDGDLTKRVQTRTVGEMRSVALLMNEFLDNLHETVSTIRVATDTINDSVGQVSRQTQSTGSFATEINKSMMAQSMNLEDCSTSVSRIDELLQSTSESTRQAASLSRLAMDRALKGGSSVQETVGAMEKIEESAHKVEFLVSTIQGIATQTNLLAINAAIEASKAGEHGKGFAVVAEEVRKLAERSKGLTGEVTELINEVNSRVKIGSSLAKGAGTALDGIIKDVEAVSSLIQRIATASTKQTESSSRLLLAIQNVNKSVRQSLNSLLRVGRGSEMTADEVRKLLGMVARLTDAIKQFKLHDFSSGVEYDGNMGVISLPQRDTEEEQVHAVDTDVAARYQLQGEPLNESSSADQEVVEDFVRPEESVAEMEPEQVPLKESPSLEIPSIVTNSRKLPELVAAPESALSDPVDSDHEESQSFYTADELSREIRANKDEKEEVA